MIFLLLALISISAFSNTHLPLEMSSAQYKKLLDQQIQIESIDPKNSFISTQVKDAIALGERLGQWIALINSNRSETNAIRLTSKKTRKGISIDKPSIYSEKTIQAKKHEVLLNLPQEMKDILLGSGALPSKIQVSDKEFIKHARLVDRLYQTAARYKLINIYRPYYIRAQRSDVRGYYYFVTNKIDAKDLGDNTKLPQGEKGNILLSLAKLCMNANNSLSNCIENADKAFTNNQLAEFYTTYFPSAQENWDHFFEIPSYGVRSDVSWQGNTATVPFNTPQVDKFIPYLQDNIEDEFQYKNWGLKIEWGTFSNGPRLEFEAGTTPHVNQLGGNVITMDSNQPIEEYESQWTIRHEYGHILGLPDCYHEFYDTELDAYVNYQLDVDDLMCSRAGNMNERIYLELKKAYE